MCHLYQSSRVSKAPPSTRAPPPPLPLSKRSHLMKSGNPWKYRWRKRPRDGRLKSLPSPTSLPHPSRKETPKCLVICYSLKGRVMFGFCNNNIYLFLPWSSLIFCWPPSPSPLICSQFYIVLRLTVLRTTASLSVPLENHAILPPPPLKKTKFPPTPQAIKITLPLISLFT